MAHRDNQRGYQWYLLGALWAAALLLGIVGFGRHAAWQRQEMTTWDAIYLTFQLIPMNSGAVSPPLPWELQLARFLIPLLTALAAIKALLSLFRQQVQVASLRFARGHYLVCGLGRKGMHLVRALRRDGRRVVAIERDENSDALEACRELGAIVITGDATEPGLLARAGVARADALFAVCDDDGTNAEIALSARRLVSQRADAPLDCLAHIADPRLCALLREREQGLESTAFRLELFNVYESGARRLLQEYPPWEPPSTPRGLPHLLVVGLGRMGESLLLAAAANWERAAGPVQQRLRISVLDRYARSKVESLQVRVPALQQACCVLPLTMEVGSSEFERGAFLRDGEGRPAVSAVYICFDDDSLSLRAALALQRMLPADGPRIVLRMAEENGLARLLRCSAEGDGARAPLGAFGLLDHTCAPHSLLPPRKGD
jgi:hypothetical protein